MVGGSSERCLVIAREWCAQATLPHSLPPVILLSAMLCLLKIQNLLNADFLLSCVQLLTLVSVAVIQKLPNKVYSVGLALSTLWSQLSLLPVPYSKEQIQTDDYGLCQCCKAVTEFMRPFVEEATDNKENKENEKLKDELLKL